MSLPRRLATAATAAAVVAVTATGGISSAAAASAPAGTTDPTTTTTTSMSQQRTVFGVSLPYQAGETIAQSVEKYRSQFGALPVVRVFDDAPPPLWKNNATLAALGAGSSVIYSFQGDMNAIAAGAYDNQLTTFLNSRPAGVKVWVVLHHEPEDEVKAGRFTTAQFRAATAHIAPVVKAAGGIPTTVLMAWTLDPASGRNWRDYYSPAVDVMAYDAYNSGQARTVPTYKPAEKFVDPVLAVARETGKPFGWAELGSPCIATDPTCVGRAAWLNSLGSAFSTAGAQFVSYWNRPSEDAELDFSLVDAPSIAAWRTQVLSSVNQPPAVSAQVDCFELSCTADGSASSDADGAVASHTWSWGDGTTSTGASATHAYAAPGTYTVRLTVTDNQGGSSTTSRTVQATPHVNLLPVASAATPTCQLTVCSFDGSASSDADGTVRSAVWSFGDGTTGTGTTTTHRYAKAGTYPVTLTVTDDQGGSSSTTSQLTVTARPIAFRGSSSVTSASATLLQATVPTGVQPGDALLLKVSTNGTGSNPQVPAGWSEVTRQLVGTSMTVVWQRVATAQDVPGGRIPVQLANPIKSSIQVLAYGNTAETLPATVSATAGDDVAATAHTAPGAQVTEEGSWVLTLYTDKSSSTTAWALPTELTVRASTYGTGTGYLTTVLADEGAPRSPGVSPARTATTDAASRATMTTIVLAPATR